MKKPVIDEIFTDNGQHDYWRLIDGNGEELCSELDKDKVEELSILLEACRDREKTIGMKSISEKLLEFSIKVSIQK